MASSSPSKTLGVPPTTPKRSPSKRTRAQLETEHRILRWQQEDARKKVKPSHSFDVEYWLSAAAVSEIWVQKFEVETKLAIQDWREADDAGDTDTSEWWSKPEAHHLVEKLKAATYEKRLYMQQAEKIQRGGPMRRAFQSMFTTSQIGLGDQKVGVGTRTKSQQSQFRQSLIQGYDASITDPRKPDRVNFLYAAATDTRFATDHIRAAHIVPHFLGPDALVALFGVNIEGELDTPYNGLLLPLAVANAMDDGALAIVPDIPGDPSTEEVAAWESKEPKEYKWKIMDDEAEILDQAFIDCNFMSIRDLGGQRLFFKNDMRPRARYLYFLFTVAQLKLAWRHDYHKDPTKVLKKQLGGGFWATKGRYLNRAFLLALAEEIGHDALAYNIPMEPGGDNEPDETGIIGIAKLLQFKKRHFFDEEDEDEDEDEDEEDDD
jgi:hypothetical protein